ncbi:glycosyltransferase family 4 protein [Dermacoccus nishinomiyaensis]|uniref:glycosyltransferase family 4 protein n=1 Tax=Dermacoccus nishinomiyaensis TaxID=1274 RepID=UPI000E08CC92|nr:glycosyltransferase family 4 protein [Dermacoccus nishinomiyaensis]QQY24203.1 glycosyltransferase family 4 protein [Dermacoccus nishinomiyaensis]STD71261.1 Spore coat protein SA [Dermacoccus nishinomiyaensis]
MLDRLTIASNQGTFGGGEVMLLAIAEAARELEIDVTVVAPADPGEVVRRARLRGFSTVAIPGSSRRSYLTNLRRWDQDERQGILWCNGLRPAFATSGHVGRVVHLHQEPRGPLAAASHLARRQSLATIVPSDFMSHQIPGSTVLTNWTAPPTPRRHRAPAPTPRIGYLGRLSSDKGVPVLCDAVRSMIDEGIDVELLLAGDARFVSTQDERRVSSAIHRLGDSVTCPGWMDRNDFFSAIDLAVFPSTWAEPFGLVAAEAMGARCPFVVSDSGALPEVVGADYPFVARAGDAEDLARTLTAGLDAPWSEMLTASYERWEALFSPEAGRGRLATLLQSLPTSTRGVVTA